MKLDDIVLLEKARINVVIQFTYDKECFGKISELIRENRLIWKNNGSSKEIPFFEKSVKQDDLWFDDMEFRKRIFGENSMEGCLCTARINNNVGLEFKKNTVWNRNNDPLEIRENEVVEYKFVENDPNKSVPVPMKEFPIDLYFWDSGLVYLVFRFDFDQIGIQGDGRRMKFSFLKKVLGEFTCQKNRNHLKIEKRDDKQSVTPITLSLKELMFGKSGSVLKQIEKVFLQVDESLDLKFENDRNLFREKYIITAFSKGEVNGAISSVSDIRKYIDAGQYENLLKEADFILQEKHDVIMGYNQAEGYANHYWKLTEDKMICLTYRDSYLERKGGFMDHVSLKYMILYQYCMNVAFACRQFRRDRLDMEDDVMEKREAYLEGLLYVNMVDQFKAHKHVQNLFEFYLRKLRRQFQRDLLNEEKIQKKIEESEDSDGCRLELQSDLMEDPFVFVSYSRADWKAVFKMLNQLYKNKVNIYYDKGIALEAGKHWSDSIMSVLHHKNCVGFINFISKASICSTPILHETLEADNLGIPRICISLDHKRVSQLIREPEVAFGKSATELGGTEDVLRNLLTDRVARIAKAFHLDREPEYIWIERAEGERLMYHIKSKENWVEDDWIEIF